MITFTVTSPGGELVEVDVKADGSAAINFVSYQTDDAGKVERRLIQTHRFRWSDVLPAPGNPYERVRKAVSDDLVRHTTISFIEPEND